MATPHLTLLMVVRDAADALPGLLRHHAPLVDATVVVDTGSADATLRLAAAAGARTVAHRWADDFAAARNAGLAACAGDWILILDDDEVIAPGDFARLRAALAGGPRVLLQPTINYHRDPRHPEWRPVTGRYPEQEAGQVGYFQATRAGLFPVRDDLRFVGRIHESILPAARNCGLAAEALDVPVHHYGYVQGAGRNEARRRRDADLVERKFREDPDDPAAILEWATVLLERGRATEARPLLARLARTEPVTSAVTRGRFLLGRLLREEGDPAGAATLLASAVAADDRSLFCWLEWVRALADQERWGDVDAVLGRARQRHGDDPLLDKETFRCLVKTGRLDQAGRVVNRLLRHYPAWGALRDLAGRIERSRNGTG